MENTVKKPISAALLAHVDAGKTTLAESILYLTGSIRKLGRVDHKDAFLDTNRLERERGITIFSKQARFHIKDWDVTLLDTPGHVDFSAEMERTLQVLDYAILVISGADKIPGHVLTLWQLLKRYEVPVFLFVNKMDQVGTDKEEILKEITQKLDSRCVDFGQEQDALWENIAMCEEQILEKYLETQTIEVQEIQYLIAKREVFPCYFGSALKVEGVQELLDGMALYMKEKEYGQEFAARVYKISRDEQNKRLTHMKITGGSLQVKTLLKESWEEKVDQIRLYSGEQYQMVSEVSAGMICAVTGLTQTYSGEGLGNETSINKAVLEPVLTYQIHLPEGSDVHDVFLKLRKLEEEDPQLHIVWEEEHQEIHVQVMGEVQIEVLKSILQERFGIEAEFHSGSIVYKETIENPVEGVGHFEPLRHYAEVHLWMEPLESGSGLIFDTSCSEDELDLNWQRLILTHLKEKKHRGVLTGAEITDMKITLVAGRAHPKHTEGGDFRQATYRAVRQGLKRTQNVLLEPFYQFRIEVPTDKLGRALADIQKMYGEFEPPLMEGEMTVIVGSAPVIEMQGYQQEVVAYTKGHGRFSCSLKGYFPCHNQEKIIEEKGYDSEKDIENPTGSVFCAHGAGFLVDWNQVPEYMHLESFQKVEKEENHEVKIPRIRHLDLGYSEEKELEEIFSRTYGNTGEKRSRFQKSKSKLEEERWMQNVSHISSKRQQAGEEYLLVDGYNIIFAWDELKELSKTNLEAARNKLMDILSNYQGFKKMTLILVFDAYKVVGNPGEVTKYHNIHVIYTREAETADQYIEKTVHEIGRKNRVTVATSDALEQVIIFGQGANRLSAKGLKEEIDRTQKEIKDFYEESNSTKKNYLLDGNVGFTKEDIRDILKPKT